MWNFRYNILFNLFKYAWTYIVKILTFRVKLRVIRFEKLNRCHIRTMSKI